MQILRWAGFCLALLASPALADAPKPFPSFSAKRVRPPAPNSKQRITVQITPRAPEVPRAPAAEGAGTGTTATPAVMAQRYAWFWQDVSPDLAQQSAGRLEHALVRVTNPPAGQGVVQPRLQQLQDIAATHGPDILRASIGTRVSPALVMAVIAVESSGRVDAVSGAGAQGLMQLMPATAERFGVDDRLSPTQNIAGGVRFLDFLVAKFDADPILVLAGYNAGENAVDKHDGVPPYPETRDYVPKVLAAFQVAKSLCATPPELISDGCAIRLAGQ